MSTALSGTPAREARIIPSPGSSPRLALLLMLASGFAGLGYQIVWTQQSALWLGHESAAVLAVVTAFFGGTAFGALSLGARIARSARPRLWYAACELSIGIWSLVLAMLLGPFTAWLLDLIGSQPSPLRHWSLAFGGCFLLLLPATAAMGATLPAMERLLSGWQRQGSSIAALYAANTFGAVLGVLATAFLLVPQWGLLRAAASCAALNLICALAAWKLFADTARSPQAELASSGRLRYLPLLAASGLLGIGYEVLVIRVISQAAENTVYTFALLLAVYLVGTALGATIYQRHLRGLAAQALHNGLLRALSLACLLGSLGLSHIQAIRSFMLSMLGSGVGAALTAEAAMAVVAFLLPTLVMGALFSHWSTQARNDGISLGSAIGVNTLGAALAPLLFGLWLIPAIACKSALILVAAGYLLLSSARAWFTASQWLTAAAIALAAAYLPSLVIVDVPAGGRLASYDEGSMAAVSVVESADGVASLHIDNRQQEGSSATLFADARQALLPMLLHPAPHQALFLGLGTGVTAASAAQNPDLQVDAVELLPEVIRMSMARFIQPMLDETSRARLHLMSADARRYVRTADRQYDLIISDNFHPARSGSGSLYTVEHFSAVRNRLSRDGVFCQWLPLHQLDLDTLRSIVRAFLAVYPQAWAMLASNSLDTPTLGLVARGDGQRFDLAALRRGQQRLASTRSLADFDADDDFTPFGAFVAGPRSLAHFSEKAALNTDDHPVVAYRAPRITYAPDSLPRDRLLDLLHEVRIDPDELLSPPTDLEWNKRLVAYWTAHNRYIEAGYAVRPTPDVRRMLAQVQEPLLAVLHTSPDFQPAYDPLLQMAIALAPVDSTAACSLLHRLQQLQPSRPETAEALQVLCARPD